MIASLFELYGISCFSTFIWVLNAEVAAVLYAGMEDPLHPFVIGLVIALGQCTSYVFFLKGGGQLTRFRKIREVVQATKNRFRERLKTGFVSLTITAALFGVPPVIAMVLLARPFGMAAWPIIGLAFAGRLCRFTLLAYFGEAFSDVLSFSNLF